MIITYNRPDDMLALVENISRLDAIDELLEEVIIVNNNSSVSYKPVEDFISNHSSIPFRYFNSIENLGVSRGRNYAIQQSHAPVLFFLDDDALIQNMDALRNVVSIFKESEDANGNLGITAFKVYYYDTMELQQNAFPHKRFNERKSWHSFHTAYFSGCAHAIHRRVFDAAGYYPDNFFYGMEEYDLSYRAIDAGFSIRYDDRVVILHKESPTGRLTPREKLLGMWVNKSKVAWKYLPKYYFFTTAFLWSLQYFKKSKWDLKGVFKGWSKISGIPQSEKRKPVNARAMRYLKQVKARLMY